jgi:hypothetical protein
MKRIALATCAAWPELTEDDRLLIPALQQLDFEAVPAVWMDQLTGPGLIKLWLDRVGTIT